MRFPFYIAKRYLFTKSANSAVNVISSIAALGVIVGALSLFVVLSGFAGLKDFSIQFSSIFDSDLKAIPQKGKSFQFTEEQKNALENLDEVTSYSQIIEERVFLNFKGKNAITNIKGVDENYQRTTVIDSTIAHGQWFDNTLNYVVIGYDIAGKLSLGAFDYSDLLEIYVPKPGIGQITDPTAAFNKTQVMVSGIYHVNEDLNGKYVFASFDLAKELLNFPENQVSALEFKLSGSASEKETIQKIEPILGQDLVYKNRIQQNDALYKMLNTENLAVYLIFTLVLIIALFNVIASIIMVILDKKHNIKTLLHLGASIAEIRFIFFLQGVMMSVFGGFAGILLGVLVIYLQLQFGFVTINGILPYPVKLEVINVVIVFLTIVSLGVIASKIASNRVNEKLLV